MASATLPASPNSSVRTDTVRASCFLGAPESCPDAAATGATATAQESERTEGWDAGPIGSGQSRGASSGSAVGTGSMARAAQIGANQSIAPHSYIPGALATHLACSDPHRVLRIRFPLTQSLPSCGACSKPDALQETPEVRRLFPKGTDWTPPVSSSNNNKPGSNAIGLTAKKKWSGIVFFFVAGQFS